MLTRDKIQETFPVDTYDNWSMSSVETSDNTQKNILMSEADTMLLQP